MVVANGASTGAEALERRIVVGVDGSDGGYRALEWALAEARYRDALVQIVHAWTYPAAAGLAPMSADLFSESAAPILEGAMRLAAEVDPGARVKGETVQRTAALALIEASKGADMLVVGSRGRGGFAGLLLGSVSQQCASHAECPVVVVPSQRRRGR
jgi:nucleotide-binding universal stress UspA family protein